jgi:hypothetical protein
MKFKKINLIHISFVSGTIVCSPFLVTQCTNIKEIHLKGEQAIKDYLEKNKQVIDYEFIPDGEDRSSETIDFLNQNLTIKNLRNGFIFSAAFLFEYDNIRLFEKSSNSFELVGKNDLDSYKVEVVYDEHKISVISNEPDKFEYIVTHEAELALAQTYDSHVYL